MLQSYAFPGRIEEDILQIAAQQIPYMRTQWFSQLMKENEQMLLKLIGCSGGRVMFFTSSGTGAMDAIVQNYAAAQGKAFVIDGGSFGHRWAELCQYHGVEHEVMQVPFACDIDYDELERRVAQAQVRVLLCQHHETSSGQLFDLQRISDICKAHDVSLVADVISSFLADPLDMDAMGIDVAVTSTQKGLNLPPGVALVFLSKKALDVPFLHNNYYFDFQDNLKNLERGQTPFSPATTLFMQLHERLQRNMQLGVDALVETTQRKAHFFRQLCQKYGWEIPAQRPSNAITGFYVRHHADILFTELQKQGIYIMPSGGRKDFFRVSHMGAQVEAELEQLAAAIAKICS